MKTNQLFERVGAISDMGMAKATAEGEPPAYDHRVRIGVRDYRPITFRTGFAITGLASYTDLYNAVKEPGPELARAMIRTKEQVVANIFNNSFDAAKQPGIDGKALCAFDHPHASGVPNGTNRGDGVNDLALSYSSLETAVVQLMEQRSHRGNPAVVSPPYRLLVPIKLWPVAWRLTNTERLPGTADNDKSFIQPIITPFWNPYLTDPDNYWLMTSNKEDRSPFLLYRRGLMTKSSYDIDTDSYKFVLLEEYVGGFTDYRGIWGSAP
jgi:hypothetical protein